MSLFGTSPPPAARPTKSSLFDDDESASKATGSGLFADDNDNGGESPWDFPQPKKSARRNVVKTLLPASDVPDSYVDAYDSLLSSSGGAGVSLEQVKQLLAESRVGAAEQGKILEIVGGSGESLTRGEVNVLLALIGLAQEGEELSLDAVDERRRSKSALLPRHALVTMIQSVLSSN